MTPADLRAAIRADRFLAHEILFAHRHPYEFAAYHRDLVADFWSPEPFIVDLAFREAAKTTLAEECVTIAAGDGEHFEPLFYNCMIVCAKESLAAEMLTNVKVEIEQNEMFAALYGDIRGAVWTTTKITLRSGRCIQAVGRDQSLRGTKHLQWRPDLVIVNDFEDENEALSDDDRKKTLDWVLGVLLRACDSSRRKIRVYDSRTDPATVPMRLIRQAGWRHRLIPVSYIDNDGVEQPSWPGHPNGNMGWIEKERQLYRDLGRMHIWDQEMMMRTEGRTASSFRESTFRVVPRERVWESVYIMYDPARTIGRKSAMTGKAVWSWVGRKLVVWEGSAHNWLPDQLVRDLFQAAEVFDPVWLMVEEDGLNEWLKTPIRDEGLRRGMVVPYRGVKAPRDKQTFIQGLQLYFEAGEIEFAGEYSDLRAQLLSFPRPPIDAPNALAYALLTKPGRPIYDNFRDEHVVADLRTAPFRPAFLAGNAGDGWVTAALLQIVDGRIIVLADWACVGLPEERIAEIQQEAAMLASSTELYRGAIPRGWDSLKDPMAALNSPILTRRAAPQWVIPQFHFDRWLNIGLSQAISRLPARAEMGGDEANGREFLRSSLGKYTHGDVSVGVSEGARWTLRALAGGYCRGKNVEPEPGPYRTLMVGIEACLGRATLTAADDEDEGQNFSVDRQGRAYKSILPQRERRVN